MLKKPNETGNLPDKEFKTIVVRILTKVKKRIDDNNKFKFKKIDEHSENFGNQEHIKKDQSEFKDSILQIL